MEQSLPMLLLRAREAVMQHFRPLLAEHGVTEQQWRVLRVLCEQNGLEAKDLAQRTLMLQPSMTGVLDRLERDGFVERRSAPGDGRKVTIWLTRKAKRIYERVAPQAEATYARLQRSFAGNDWDSLYAGLKRLIELNGTRNHVD
jgi:homoprotocatechuate degradation regulator HpaR